MLPAQLVQFRPMTRQDPHSHADLSQGSVRHATVALDADFATRRLSGTVRLRLAEAPGGSFDLDTRGLEIASVKSGGHDLPFELGDADPIVGRRLRVTLPAACPELEVRFTTAPAASALGWLEPSQTAGGQHPFLFTQCQPHHARSIFPCQDSSEVRMTWDGVVTVPDPLVVVAAAAPGRPVDAPAGRRAYAFEMPQPIPSYLFAFAAGDLASRNLSPRSRIWAEPSVVERAAHEFAEVERMIGVAEGLFGPYDWERYDLLVLPPSFPYGGMENPRLTFLTPTVIAGDRSLVNVVAHELAHSWTGNLVTNANVEHFWLNEGFTVWAERRILEGLEGKDGAALHAAVGRNDLDDAIRRFGADSPHTALRTHLQGIDPDEVYSEVPYEKGFLFLTLLEQTAGRERWDAFVRDYMTRFRFGTITTEGFLAFVEECLPGLSKKVDFRHWTEDPGLPDDAPRFPSERLERLDQAAAKWPALPATDGWSPLEHQLYLQRLPHPTDAAACRALDAALGLTASGNHEILVEWLTLAVASGDADVLPKVREVLTSVGRMKYLRPLYKALLSRPETRPVAREIFDAAKNGYHPVACSIVEGLIKAAG